MKPSSHRIRSRCTTLTPDQFARCVLALIHDLRALMPDQDVESWLWTPQPSLDGRAPVMALKQGDVAQVAALVQTLRGLFRPTS